jgi:hypothetical protein
MGQVGAGGDFRNHAAKGGMVSLLRQYSFRQDPAVRVQHGRRGFVARRLDSKDWASYWAGSGTVNQSWHVVLNAPC